MSILLAFFLGYWLYTKSPKAKPVEALAKAYSILEQETEVETARAYFEQAQAERLIAHWALLGQAQLAVRQNHLSDAKKLFESVAADSAAGLDARLGLLELSLQDAPLPNDFGQALSGLEEQVRLAGRRDLLPSLLLLKAEAARISASVDYALSLYQEIRRSYPRSPIAPKARAAYQTLSRSIEDSMAPAAKLEHAQLALSEGLLDEALQVVQKVKSGVDASSPAYFEAMSVEEDILRASGRNEEADRQLALISADGGPGIADRALLKMAKLAWNNNESDRAIGFLENFEKRYSGTSLAPQALYVKGRILEEKFLLSEAKSVYRTIWEQGTSPQESIHALRQIAWIYVREKDFINAVTTFAKLLELESTVDEPSTNVLDDPKLHALYWLAASIAELPKKERTTLPESLQDPIPLWEELVLKDPFGYYGLLAKEQLDKPHTEQTQPASQLETSKSDCLLSVPEAVSSRSRTLAQGGLAHLAQHEIDWWFFQNRTAAASTSSPLTRTLTRASLYAQAGLGSTAIGYLDDYLLDPGTEVPTEAKVTCAQRINAIRYPLLFRGSFDEAGKLFRVPVAVLLAVARTESHFDPNAQSSKNALGLLQLLESTAKQEGLTDDESLFDPDTNIRVGAKHLRRLLDDFDNNLMYAAASYNAGSQATRRWMERYPEIAPRAWAELIGYPETKKYVRKVYLAHAGYQDAISSVPASE